MRQVQGGGWGKPSTLAHERKAREKQEELARLAAWEAKEKSHPVAAATSCGLGLLQNSGHPKAKRVPHIGDPFGVCSHRSCDRVVDCVCGRRSVPERAMVLCLDQVKLSGGVACAVVWSGSACGVECGVEW